MILTAQREGDAQHEPAPIAALPAAPQMGKLWHYPPGSLKYVISVRLWFIQIFLMLFSLLIYDSDWCLEFVEVAQAELNKKEIQKTWVACQRHVDSSSQRIPWWFPGNVKEEQWQDWAMAVLLVRADRVLWSDGNDRQCPDHTAEVLIKAVNNPLVLPLIEELNSYIVDCIYHPKHK